MAAEYTEKAEKTIANALQLAKDYSNAEVYPAHLSFVLINEAGVTEATLPNGPPSSSNVPLFPGSISRAGGDVNNVRRSIQKLVVRLPAQSPPPEIISYSGSLRKVLREAQSLQKTMHDFYIAQDHLLLALLKDSSIQGVLRDNGLNEATLKTAIEHMRGNRRVESRTAEQGFDALQKYAVDLTARAEEGKIDPVIGRDNEIRRAIRILCRR